MRMEKLPSSLVIHKRVDTTDTRFTQMEGQLASNPLEKNLGFFDFGKYTKAPDNADFAFVKINEMLIQKKKTARQKATTAKTVRTPRKKKYQKERGRQERSTNRRRH